MSESQSTDKRTVTSVGLLRYIKSAGIHSHQLADRLRDLVAQCPPELFVALEKHLRQVYDLRNYLTRFHPSEILDHLLLLEKVSERRPAVPRIWQDESGTFQVDIAGFDGRGVCAAI